MVKTLMETSFEAKPRAVLEDLHWCLTKQYRPAVDFVSMSYNCQGKPMTSFGLHDEFHISDFVKPLTQRDLRCTDVERQWGTTPRSLQRCHSISCKRRAVIFAAGQSIAPGSCFINPLADQAEGKQPSEGIDECLAGSGVACDVPAILWHLDAHSLLILKCATLKSMHVYRQPDDQISIAHGE